MGPVSNAAGLSMRVAAGARSNGASGGRQELAFNPKSRQG